MDSRTFILLWDRIQCDISFLVPVAPLLATGGSFSLLSCVTLAGIYPLLCVFVLWFISLFSISLLSGTTTCSRFIYFLHTFQNLPFLQEGSFFKLENRIRKKDMGAGILVVTEMWLFWGFLDWQWQKYMMVLICCWSVAVSSSANPWTAACQVSLSFISQSVLKLTSMALVMPSNNLSSVALFSSCPKSSPASRSLPMTRLFALGGQSIGASASASVLPIRGWFPLGLTDLISLQSKGLPKVFFMTAVHSTFFMVQLSHPYMTTGKTTALTRRTFVCKVMCLLLNMLSWLDITSLPRSECLLISWLQSPSCSGFGA